MDPDSKSAATWGDASALIKREPVEEVEVPVTIEFASLGGGSGGGAAPLCLNGVARKDGTVGLALSESLDSAVGIAGCIKLGPTLEVVKAGADQGGFAVRSVRVQGKEMAAASALKGVAKAGGLQSMKGICIGMKRPEVVEEGKSSSQDDAAVWAVFEMAGVTKEGGLVLRCKGPNKEGLCPDEALEQVQFFAPAREGLSSATLGVGLGSLDRVMLELATSSDAHGAATAGSRQSLRLVGRAVIGGAGVHRSGEISSAPTVLHRQAAAAVSSGS
eukprot:TRINITY_DN85329_c0_g1_i1.p1 TRINITY_DN85329_c0_g1~~TRINITY_DN85329_c0_g1_i1.p1  ORF type:complete len:282 (-),score=55.64 TRINITY_DN85329_c0_g1_i1:93-914(-)